MEDLENKLGAILGNPEMMQKIMALAQNLGGSDNAAPPPQQSAAGIPDIDISMLQKLSGFAKNATVDPNQQTLLHALSPYISSHRVNRLERAMRAAKIASYATSFLGR